MNFGLEKGGSEVYFTWAAGAVASANAGIDLADLLPAREYNLDYVSWSDREIVLRVPDGAASGNVLVTSDKGQSNSVYFEVLTGVGHQVLHDSAQVLGALRDEHFRQCRDGRQQPLPVAAPRHPDPGAEEGSARLPGSGARCSTTNGPALYSFSNLQKGGRYHL